MIGTAKLRISPDTPLAQPTADAIRVVQRALHDMRLAISQDADTVSNMPCIATTQRGRQAAPHSITSPGSRKLASTGIPSMSGVPRVAEADGV